MLPNIVFRHSLASGDVDWYVLMMAMLRTQVGHQLYVDFYRIVDAKLHYASVFDIMSE